MGTLVYRYGLLAPTQHAELVREQMWLAHRYRNTLVEIERGRRAAVRAILSTDLAPLERAAAEAEAELVAALLVVRAARSESRSRSDTEAMRVRVKEAREKKRAAVGAFRARRAEMREGGAHREALDAIEERGSELRKSARAYCGVYWGTYLLIEDADQAARKAPLYDGADANDPRFMRWTGDGHVGVQLQGGLPADEVFRNDTRLRIATVDERAWHSESRGERRRMCRTTLSVRIGSDGRAPVWAEWPMLMHRPLPEGAVIKRANVSLARRGPREEWSVEITVTTPDERRVTTCGAGEVAIDLGWRIFGDELRVAAWAGSDGARGELRLTAALLVGFTKVEDLRGIRDGRFNAARTALITALGAIHETPTWLSEATATIAQWRSAGRLAALALRWRKARFDGDAAAYDALEAWRYHDHHLWAWEANQRPSSLRRRKDTYRVFAAMLARRYGTLVLEAFDLRRVARHQPAEAAKAENETARRSRQVAAVSELRLCLEQAFRGRGGTAETVDAANTTKTCNACGHLNAFDAATYVHHACIACGAIWDQDENAALNLLERWRAAKTAGGAREDEKEIEAAAPRETRWAKAKRMKAEKDARIGTAREAASNVAKS